MTGPIASYLTNKLGWRITTVIGSVIGAAGEETIVFVNFDIDIQLYIHKRL